MVAMFYFGTSHILLYLSRLRGIITMSDMLLFVINNIICVKKTLNISIIIIIDLKKTNKNMATGSGLYTSVNAIHNGYYSI